MVAQIELLHPVRAAVYAADSARLTLHLHLVAEGFLAQVETLCRFFIAFDEDGHRFICDLVVFADALNQNGVFARLLPDGQRGQLALNFRLRSAAGHVEHRVRLFAVDAGGAAVLILDDHHALAAVLAGEHALARVARLRVLADHGFLHVSLIVIRLLRVLALRLVLRLVRKNGRLQIRHALARLLLAEIRDRHHRILAVRPALDVAVNRAVPSVANPGVAVIARANGHVALYLAVVIELHAAILGVAAHAALDPTVVGRGGLTLEVGFRAHRAGLAVVGDGERGTFAL